MTNKGFVGILIFGIILVSLAGSVNASIVYSCLGHLNSNDMSVPFVSRPVANYTLTRSGNNVIIDITSKICSNSYMSSITKFTIGFNTQSRLCTNPFSNGDCGVGSDSLHPRCDLDNWNFGSPSGIFEILELGESGGVTTQAILDSSGTCPSRVMLAADYRVQMPISTYNSQFVGLGFSTELESGEFSENRFSISYPSSFLVLQSLPSEVINCSINSGCGSVSASGGLYCKDGNVFQNFTLPLCNFPNTTSSFCSFTTQQNLNKTCANGCLNGACIVSQCVLNSDCGSVTRSNFFCSGNNVVQNVTSPICNIFSVGNFCSFTTSQITNQTCANGCSNGVCLPNPACVRDIDCGNAFTSSNFCSGNNVVNTLTTPRCINSGSQNAFCRNDTSQVTETICSVSCLNGQCTNPQNETNAPIVNLLYPSNNFIFNSSLVNFIFNVSDASNINLCAANVSGNVINNQTAVIKVGNNTISSNLVAGNYSAYVFCIDQFGNRGNSNSVNFSVATRNNITCNFNSDCGTNGFINDFFCDGGDVFGDYVTFTCNNAGTSLSSCSSSTESKLKQSCSEDCSNGKCKRVTSTISVNNDTDTGISFVSHASNSSNKVIYLASAANSTTPQMYLTGANGTSLFGFSGSWIFWLVIFLLFVLIIALIILIVRFL